MSNFTDKIQIHLKWLLLWLLSPAVLGLSGCSGNEIHESPSGDLSDSEYSLTFDIMLENPGATSTRAPEGDYNEGNSWENYIDVIGQDYRVLFFLHNPNVFDGDFYLGSLHDIKLTLIAENTIQKTYQVNGKIHNETARQLMGNPIKIVVFANWGVYQNIDEVTLFTDPLQNQTIAEGPTALSDIWKSAEFDFIKTLDETGEGQYPLRLNNLIPFYGVSDPVTGVLPH